MTDVYGPKAHFHGQDLPRCQATPDEPPGPSRWGCALPAGHGDPDPESPLAQLGPGERHTAHSWIKVGD